MSRIKLRSHRILSQLHNRAKLRRRLSSSNSSRSRVRSQLRNRHLSKLGTSRVHRLRRSLPSSHSRHLNPNSRNSPKSSSNNSSNSSSSSNNNNNKGHLIRVNSNNNRPGSVSLTRMGCHST